MTFVKDVKSKFPSVKTQVQYDALVLAFAAFEATVTAHLEMDVAARQEASKTLTMALEALSEATRAVSALEENPEVQAPEMFRTEPKKYDEDIVLDKLLTELDGITCLDDLSSWYDANKTDFNRIETQALRNRLFDRIRARKQEFGL